MPAEKKTPARTAARSRKPAPAAPARAAAEEAVSAPVPASAEAVDAAAPEPAPGAAEPAAAQPASAAAAAVRPAAAAALDDGSALVRGLGAIGQTAAERMLRSAEIGLETARSLLACHSPEDVFRVHADLVRLSTEAAVDDWARVMGAFGDVWAASLAPLQRSVSGWPAER